jgi:hypothetical protein
MEESDNDTACWSNSRHNARSAWRSSGSVLIRFNLPWTRLAQSLVHSRASVIRSSMSGVSGESSYSLSGMVDTVSEAVLSLFWLVVGAVLLAAAVCGKASVEINAPALKLESPRRRPEVVGTSVKNCRRRGKRGGGLVETTTGVSSFSSFSPC